eukprot:3891440-Karenia_brevis.AAC.1
MSRRDNYNPHCYYLRGLQPKANPTPTVEPQWIACGLGKGACLQPREGEVIIYTDGSGGERSSDPRLR